MEQKTEQNVIIGNNLRKFRNNAGISQEKLCAELQLSGCDIGRSTYAKYEAGELTVKTSVLKALTKIFKCSMEELTE